VGAVGELGRGWTFVEGGRDEVLASVSDALLAEALAAVKRRVGFKRGAPNAALVHPTQEQTEPPLWSVRGRRSR
jgi:hypothetical protein